MEKRAQIKILTSIFFILILGFTIFAYSSNDNIKTYDENINTISITTSSDSNLAEYQLIENSDNCLMNCYAIGKVKLYQNNVLFSDMNFKDDKSVNRAIPYNLFIGQENSYEINIPTYSEVCTTNKVYDNETSELIREDENCEWVQNGTKKEIKKEINWQNYNGEELLAGEYFWKIEGKKSPEQKIDWIASSFDIALDNWAWWNSSCNYKTNFKIEPVYTDPNQLLVIEVDTTGANWETTRGHIYVIDNRTNTELAWINTTIFNQIKTNISTNTSVTANTEFGIDIYYDCTGTYRRIYNYSHVYLVGNSFEEASEVDATFFDLGGGGTAGSSSTDFQYDLESSYLTDNAGEDYWSANLSVYNNKDILRNVTIMWFLYWDEGNAPVDACEDGAGDRQDLEISYSNYAITVCGSNLGIVPGNVGYRFGGGWTDSGLKRQDDGWNVIGSYISDTTIYFYANYTEIGSSANPANGMDRWRYYQDGGVYMYEDLLLMYRDYRGSNPTITNMGETSGNAEPFINLQAPENNSDLSPGSIQFIYNVSDADNDDVNNCSLWLNKNETGFSEYQVDDSITQIINQSFTESLGNGNYTWKVTCYDNNTNLGVSEIRNLTISGANNAPTIDVPTILPATAYTDSALNCTTIPYDIDLDSLTVTFEWYNGTNLYGTGNASTSNGTTNINLLTSGVQAKGETWNCTVRAFDGNNYSEYQSAVVTIQNSIPTQSAPLLESTVYYNASNENLTCVNQNTNDADDDPVTNIYSWYLNSNPISVLNLPLESNADDYSGNSNDGIINGAISVSGKYGNALEFDGIDDNVTIADSSSLDITNYITMEAWIKPDNFHSMIVDKNLAYRLWFQNGTGRFTFAVYTSGAWQEIDSTALSTGSWYHIAGTYDGSELKVYVNGNLDNTTSASGAISASAEELTIGNYKYGNYHFDGIIDEVKIYSRALSQNEIVEQYNLNYDKIVSSETFQNDVWKCKVTPNDGTADGSELESNEITVQNNVYNIIFNITEGEYGNSLTGVYFACDNGFSTTTSSSPQTYKFYENNYVCEFSKETPEYYNKTESFTVDKDKQLDIVMSLKQQLTVQEHNWLEENNILLQALYDCLYQRNCETLNLTLNYLEQINETTQDLWREFKKPDTTVVLDETVISSELTDLLNITVNYSIMVPPKEGYSDGDFLPIRIFYWFLNSSINDTCMNQNTINAKYETEDIAENPYCIPLVATTLGRINEITNFEVNLRPSLPYGNYTVVSRIEIDPNQVWIKYSQKALGIIDVLESITGEPSVSLTKIENFDDLSSSQIATQTTAVTSTSTLVATSTSEPVTQDSTQQIEKLMSGSQIITMIGMILGFLTIIVVCFTIFKIKTK